ncbi:MAG: MFS transporter, partial [Chloroflexi bacterium]|nr:MFS transporter [Chloroflexota bacterium]
MADIKSGFPERPKGIPRSPGRIFYGWHLVGIAAFMLTIMSVSVFQGLGTFLVTMQREFGWSRTVLSGAFAFTRAQGAVIGPIEGYLIDKVGSRRMILLGYLLMALGFYLFSQVHAVWQFYLAFLVINLGSGLGGLAGDHLGGQQLVRAPPLHGHGHCHVRHSFRRLPRAG